VGKLGGKGPLGRPRHRWVDDLREVPWGGVDRIVLAQHREQ
jgi:hypothetical protein